MRQNPDVGVINDIYTYDGNANPVGIADQLPPSTSNRAMYYDNLDRVTLARAPGLWGDAWYGYDALDNIITSALTAGGTMRTMTHNNDATTNRLSSITGTAGYSFNYGYDSQGNITQRGAQAYLFDIGNRMKQATGKATYAYDGLGHRFSVVGLDGVNRMQVYTQGGQLLYTGQAGAAVTTGTKYVHLNRHVIAEVNSVSTKYSHTDGLGSPVAQTETTGAVASRTHYEPYGQVAAGPAKPIGFTGHVNDIDTGLTYMQQRYYDPIAGRMLSIDPVLTDRNTGGNFNRYNYATNNPYKFIDPDGRQSRDTLDPSHNQGPHAEVHKMLTKMADAVKVNVSLPPITAEGANKTQLNLGPVEVSHTIKVDKSSSTFVGVRSGGGFAIQNVTEGQAKVGAMSGPTIKASTSMGVGRFGLSGGVSASAGNGTNSGGLQSNVGMARASNNFSLGVAPPGVSIGWTFLHAPPQP